MRVGWMRPSAISFVRDSRATSRRTGSKDESMTASGVSSMIRSTPVACSRARMLRPSRPMMRPFISSLGMVTDGLGRLHRGLGGAALDGLGDDPARPAPGLFLGLRPRSPAPGRWPRAPPPPRSRPPAQRGPRPPVSPAMRSSSWRWACSSRSASARTASSSCSFWRQLPVALLQALALALELLLALRQALLPALHLRPALAGVLLGRALELDRLLLRLEHQLLLPRPGLLQNPLGVRLGQPGVLRAGPLAQGVPRGEGDRPATSTRSGQSTRSARSRRA